MSQYIPDITERFPEGFDGVDLTDSYFPSRKHWTEQLSEEHNDESEIPYEEEPKRFEIGNRYIYYGIFGGVTHFTIKEIDRENNKITCSQTWEDLDGSGTRPDETFELSEDENENERFIVEDSERYGKHYVFA